MHLSILIPGGKGAGNGLEFDREFYPHRRAFDKDFLHGCGRFAIQHAISVQSLEPRIEKTAEVWKLFIFYFCIRFWPYIQGIQYIVWILGIKFMMPRRFLWLFILNVKIFCLDLSPGYVRLF
jgi:hypothetical protein